MIPLSQVRRRTLVRFAVAAVLGNLVWEMAHVPLYTLWQTGSGSEIAYAVLHCTLGDALIAAACLGGAWAVFGRDGWPERNYATVAVATITAALCYTVFSEWLNTELRAAWAYRDIMPRLPPFGTGLTPVLQWICVPGAAFLWSAPRGK